MILKVIALVAAYWLIIVACLAKYGLKAAAMCFLISIITAVLAALVMSVDSDDEVVEDDE